ncbi:MAG: amidohydrolase family protein [Gemmataceae bacterium]
MQRLCLLACVFVALAIPRLGAQERPLAFVGGRILPVVGPTIEDGVLVVHKGKIIAVGNRSTPIPGDAIVETVSGAVIIPGLVDTHSHVGIFQRPTVPAHADGNESTGPVQPGLRAIDAVWPDDPGIRMAQAGGVTTANIMPGSGNVIGGATIYVKLRGTTVEAMRIADTVGGLKMANGENPKGYGRKGQAPATRMKVAALQREQFLKARDYLAKKAKTPPPDVDLALETLVEVLERKRTVHFHSHRADDLMTAVRLSEEFGFELVIQHGTEAYRVADELAKRKFPVSLTLVDSPGGKHETSALIEENAAILDKAGVRIAINTDDYITESRFFLRSGALAVRGGLSEAAALRALTLNPATMMHLEKRIGSLEPGKDADFAILTGSPFSVYTQVLATYIEGAKVYDRAKDGVYQTGGFAIADKTRLPRQPVPLTPTKVAAGTAAAIPPSPPNPKAGKFVIVAERLYTVSGGMVPGGVVLVEDGKIGYVGPRAGFNWPADAKVLTAAACTPGLVDAHAVVGLSGLFNVPADQDQDEPAEANAADLRVLDGFHPDEPLLEFLRQNGVTVIHAAPGRVNVLAGQTGVFRTKGHTAQHMALHFPHALLVNLGEVPKAAFQAKGPSTRMATASLLRTAFAQARDYKAERGTNPKLEALRPALAGSMPVYFSAHRSDDLLTGLRIADEFKLKPVLDLATEAYLIADRIGKTPVVVHPTMQRAGSSMETLNSHIANAATLADRGIPIAIGTGFEGYVPKTRVLRHEAAIAAANGLGVERAIRAVTLDAAKLLGVSDRFGSLETGKVADLVLYDGDPFEHATHVTHTLMDGQIVFDRADYLKLPFARRALVLFEGGGIGCCLGW